jgi:hypothetical protein
MGAHLHFELGIMSPGAQIPKCAPFKFAQARFQEGGVCCDNLIPLFAVTDFNAALPVPQRLSAVASKRKSRADFQKCGAAIEAHDGMLGVAKTPALLFELFHARSASVRKRETSCAQRDTLASHNHLVLSVAQN